CKHPPLACRRSSLGKPSNWLSVLYADRSSPHHKGGRSAPIADFAKSPTLKKWRRRRSCQSPPLWGRCRRSRQRGATWSADLPTVILGPVPRIYCRQRLGATVAKGRGSANLSPSHNLPTVILGPVPRIYCRPRVGTDGRRKIWQRQCKPVTVGRSSG